MTDFNSLFKLAKTSTNMAGVNKVILVGNLGKDPEVRHLEGGNSVANFTLATNEYYKDKQGARVERTEWHNVVIFNENLAMVQYVGVARVGRIGREIP